MAGYVASFFEQFSGDLTAPCNPPVDSGSSLSDCALWILLGIVVMSIAFEKKRSTPKQ